MQVRNMFLVTIAAALFLVPLTTYAYPKSDTHGLNLPELSNPTLVGRIMAFPSIKKMTWFLASGLSSRLDCTQALQGSTTRACQVRIFNTVTVAEDAGLNRLALPGTQSSSFQDYNSNIVRTVDEHFDGMLGAMSNGATMLLKNLAISDRIPYASIMSRASIIESDALIKAYQGDGVGTFVSDVTINGEETETYLAIYGTSAIKAVINKAQSAKGLKAADLRTALKAAVTESNLVQYGMELDQAQTFAFEQILKTYFQASAHGRFAVRKNMLTSLTDSLILIDETYTPEKYRCTVTLPLKSGAVSSVQCETEEEES